jgi:2-oxoglutarate ferredoxin oxidoreductase subunit delta
MLCISACPTKVLAADSEPNSWGYYPSKVVAMDKCIACGNCYTVCPDVAITVYKL